MLEEEEEAIDYGEEELDAPLKSRDEVSLMLDEADEAPILAQAENDDGEKPSEAPSQENSTETTSIPAVEPTLAEAEPRAEGSADELNAQDIVAQGTSKSQRDTASSSQEEKESKQRALPPKDVRENGGPKGRKDGNDPSEDLAPGWRAIQSRSADGEMYYYNERTGESVWTKPTVARMSSTASSRNPSNTAPSKKKNKKKNKNKNKQPDNEGARGGAAHPNAPKLQQRSGNINAKDERDNKKGNGGGHPNHNDDQRRSNPKVGVASQDRGSGIPSAKKGESPTVQAATQGFSIKGAAQRQIQPEESRASAPNAATPRPSNEKPQQNKRKRGQGAKAEEIASGQNGTEKFGPTESSARRMEPRPKPQEVTPASSKRQRMGESEDGAANRPPQPSPRVSAWSEDQHDSRNPRVADTYRPGSAKTVEDDRRPERRPDVPSQRDSYRKIQDDRTTERSGWSRERDRDGERRRDVRRDDIRNDTSRGGSDRAKRPGTDQHERPRQDERRRRDVEASAGAQAVRGDPRDERSNGPRASEQPNRSDGRERDAQDRQQNRMVETRISEGRKDDRDRRVMDRERGRNRNGNEGQPRDLSSINSTNSQNKRQWGKAP